MHSKESWICFSAQDLKPKQAQAMRGWRLAYYNPVPLCPNFHAATAANSSRSRFWIGRLKRQFLLSM
jgi:hypothetical protein